MRQPQSQKPSPFRHLVAAAMLVATGALHGCVSTPTEVLAIVEEPLPPSDARVRKGGEVPKIGRVPRGETSQMSQEEKEDIKSTFAPVIANDGVAEAKAAEAKYQAEVDAMKKLLEEQKRKVAAQDEL